MIGTILTWRWCSNFYVIVIDLLLFSCVVRLASWVCLVFFMLSLNGTARLECVCMMDLKAMLACEVCQLPACFSVMMEWVVDSLFVSTCMSFSSLLASSISFSEWFLLHCMHGCLFRFFSQYFSCLFYCISLIPSFLFFGSFLVSESECRCLCRSLEGETDKESKLMDGSFRVPLNEQIYSCFLYMSVSREEQERETTMSPSVYLDVQCSFLGSSLCIIPVLYVWHTCIIYILLCVCQQILNVWGLTMCVFLLLSSIWKCVRLINCSLDLQKMLLLFSLKSNSDLEVHVSHPNSMFDSDVRKMFLISMHLFISQGPWHGEPDFKLLILRSLSQ